MKTEAWRAEREGERQNIMINVVFIVPLVNLYESVRLNVLISKVKNIAELLRAPKYHLNSFEIWMVGVTNIYNKMWPLALIKTPLSDVIDLSLHNWGCCSEQNICSTPNLTFWCRWFFNNPSSNEFSQNDTKLCLLMLSWVKELMFVCSREESAENTEPVELFWKADKKSIHQIDDGNSTKSFSFGMFCSMHRIKKCVELFGSFDTFTIRSSTVHSRSSSVHRSSVHCWRNDQPAVPGHREASGCFVCSRIQWYVM